jgi:hypothetical protein
VALLSRKEVARRRLIPSQKVRIKLEKELIEQLVHSKEWLFLNMSEGKYGFGCSQPT